ncbi:MAG: TetR family transcriptional regulator [Actinobacteria bacterium HGW-Actinobacteria-6]|nr:MAG: TetR family transcriptional regulator [Actinobacteria bacterium HGW-Actinobacteria-6]
MLVCQESLFTEAPPATGGIIVPSKNSKEPRETLNRERVLRAAVSLADECGIDSVTMRELGRRLEVKAASLYNHIASRDDLLGGMVDLALSEIAVPTEGVFWKETMRRRAISAREVFARHRWAAGLIDSRDRTGPDSLAYVDRVLGVLIQAGFSPAAAANAFLVLDSYLYGFERQRPDVSIEDGFERSEAARKILAAIPHGGYQNAARVAMEYAEHPFDQEAAFEFGLGLILDGLERQLGADSTRR